MHQTTIRFGPDLWMALESEAARAGVSIAQYVRDAAVQRLALARSLDDLATPGPARGRGRPSVPTRLAERIQTQLDSAQAVRAQGQLARERAKSLRIESDALRHRMLSP